MNTPKAPLLIVIINRTITLDKDAISLYIVYILLLSINQVTENEIKPFILHKPILYQSSCILQVMFKKHTQVSILYTNVLFLKHSL